MLVLIVTFWPAEAATAAFYGLCFAALVAMLAGPLPQPEPDEPDRIPGDW